MTHLGEIIKQERLKKKETQEKLAEVIGVSRQTILNWEKGKTLPDSASLVKIAKHYHVSFDDMIGLETETKAVSRMLWKKLSILLAILSVGFVANIGNNSFIPLLTFVLLVIFLIQEYRMAKQ